MSNIAIKVECLIKHEKKESYQTVQDMLLNGSKNIISSLNPFNKNIKKKDDSTEEFWALDDVTMRTIKGITFGLIFI